MSQPAQDGPGQLLEPLLDYGCSHWKTSSQRAADLYDSGVKLWQKKDLVDIEQQLAQSCTAETFTVRRYDGILLQHSPHQESDVWGSEANLETICQIQEYWRLVRFTPDAPPGTYHCTYLVDWANQTTRNYEGPIDNVRLLFETSQQRWNASATCEAFTSQFRKLLGGDGNTKKVTKIICFGLGDMNFKPPDWWRVENDSKPEDEREPETSVVEGAFIHHVIALTMADITGNMGVRLLTQDPIYSDETKDMLQKIGFEVVGEHGAGGFAELDDESIVISAFAAAPVKQIIADFARPVAIICPMITSAGVSGRPKTPWADPESPRTREMWKEYERGKFPVLSEDTKLEESLHLLEIYSRIRE